jgi:hypothetical protein
VSITDELREYVTNDSLHYCSDYLAIADRIDAEHERAMHEPMDRDLAENGWVRLPKDANGEPIHVGDVLDGYGKTIEVAELRYGRSGWVVISGDGNGYADTFAFVHHRAPTVEDVLTEFAAKLIERGELTNGAAQTIAEYAAKLRLAGSGD